MTGKGLSKDELIELIILSIFRLILVSIRCLVVELYCRKELCLCRFCTNQRGPETLHKSPNSPCTSENQITCVGGRDWSPTCFPRGSTVYTVSPRNHISHPLYSKEPLRKACWVETGWHLEPMIQKYPQENHLGKRGVSRFQEFTSNSSRQYSTHCRLKS